MEIRSLTLSSVRSHKDLSLDLCSGTHLFFGENGSGKTNILEAVSLLSHGKSFLRASPEDVMTIGESFCTVRAEVESGTGQRYSLEYVFQVSPRRASAFFVRDVRTPLIDFIGSLPTVAFLPQSLGMFTGSPSDRRAFVDAMIAQLSPSFLRDRMEYERILRQRSHLLKAISSGTSALEELDPWDRLLAEVGCRIALARRGTIERLAHHVARHLALLGEAETPMDLRYAPGVDASSPEEFVARLRTARSYDIARGLTTIGPHRDDWMLLAGSRDIGVFWSRGQQRSAFLALLFASADLFFEHRAERPVILLDDVLSELDAAHQDALFLGLRDHQVLLTAALLPHRLRSVTVWNVQGGGDVSPMA